MNVPKRAIVLLVTLAVFFSAFYGFAKAYEYKNMAPSFYTLSTDQITVTLVPVDFKEVTMYDGSQGYVIPIKVIVDVNENYFAPAGYTVKLVSDHNTAFNYWGGDGTKVLALYGPTPPSKLKVVVEATSRGYIVAESEEIDLTQKMQEFQAAMEAYGMAQLRWMDFMGFGITMIIAGLLILYGYWEVITGEEA